MIQVLVLTREHCHWCDEANALLGRLDTAGPNIFTVSVIENATGRPTTNVGVSLYTTHLDMDMGTDTLNLPGSEPFGTIDATKVRLNPFEPAARHAGNQAAFRPPSLSACRLVRSLRMY